MGSRSRGRHCMVVHAYYPHDPRVEREVRILRRAGYDVDVVCLRGPDEVSEETINGARVHRLPVARHRGSSIRAQLAEYLAFFALASVALVRLHRRRRFGVVQLHNVPDFLVFAGLVPKLAGARVLLDLHDLTPEFYASRTEKGMADTMVRLVRVQERLSAGFADHVLTVSELWRDTLISRNVPAEKVDVVMNVADHTVFRPEVRTAAPGREEFRLLYHGTVTHRYGLDLALEAVARVRERARLQLVVHGQGEFLPEIRALAERLHLLDLTQFSTESLPSEELALLIGTADAGLVPYRSDVFTDGILPTKLMEYASIGIPAIVSRTPVVERYFDSSMVRFVAPGSVDDLAAAIVELAADPALRASMGQAIMAFTRKHSFDRQAASYLAVVDRLHGVAERHNVPAIRSA